MNKILCNKLLLIIGLLMSFMSMQAYDFEVDSVYYNILSMDELTCEVDGGHPDLKDLALSGIISFKSREFKVNGIKEEAFKNSGIVSLSIVNGLEGIAQSAFKDCKNLESVNLESVKVIEKEAFSGCSKISQLNFGSLESVGYNAFYDCGKLGEMTLPGSLQTVVNSYSLPRNVEKVTFLEGDSVLDLSEQDIYKWRIININRNISKVKESEGRSCDSIIIGKNVSIFPSYLGGYLKNWDLTNTNIKVIAQYAFRKYQDDHYQEKSPSLESVKLPITVDSIKYKAFSGTSITEITLPASLKFLGECVFAHCVELERVELPGALREIPKKAFKDCYKLSSVKLNEGIEIIGESAFEYAGLKWITISQTLTTIGKEAFYYSEISNISIPGNVTLIEEDAFLGCKNLRAMEFEHGDSPLLIQQGKVEGNTILRGKTCRTEEEAQSNPTVYLGYMMSPLMADSVTFLRMDRKIEPKIKTEEGGSVIEEPTRFSVTNNTYVYSLSIPNSKLTRLIIGDIGCNPFIANPDTIFNSYVVYSYDKEYKYKDIYNDTYYFSPCLDPAGLTQLKEISCQMMTPPELNAEFTNSVYMNAVLRVPFGAKTAYEQAPYWKGFWEIVETDDFTSTETIKSDIIDDLPIEWYDINGFRMSGDYETFPKGLYICRQGNKTKKFLKK